ncbi:hypothetical protein YC2023_101397 [Brassica napus]
MMVVRYFRRAYHNPRPDKKNIYVELVRFWALSVCNLIGCVIAPNTELDFDYFTCKLRIRMLKSMIIAESKMDLCMKSLRSEIASSSVLKDADYSDDLIKVAEVVEKRIHVLRERIRPLE